jgi:hypothetical protein
MEEKIDFFVLIQQIRERRAALGITERDDDACRNSGKRRTEEKRRFLQDIAESCVEAGIVPFPANY